MSPTSQKSDSEEAIRSATSHGRRVLDAAASAREKRIPEPGNEAVSVWVMAACGMAVLAAGAVLGSASSWFSYDTLVKAEYVRAKAPGGDTGPAPVPALEAYMAKGEKIYTGKCLACHGPDAKGDGANYPSLVGSAWATGEDTERFGMIVLNGLGGPMSTGKTYGAGMVSQAPITAEELAGVMTYVRNNFGNEAGDVVTVEMAKAAMKLTEERGKTGVQMTKEELDANHAKPLDGGALDANAMVNPLTLVAIPGMAPAAAADEDDGDSVEVAPGE